MRIRDLQTKGVSIERLLTAAIGINAEGGEFLEIVKKIAFQGKEFTAGEKEHLKVELGDVLWYVAQACMALDVSLDEIIGQNHSLLVTNEERNSEAYQLLWDKLVQGEFHSGESRRVSKNGKEIWIQGSFNPIFDLSGKPYKLVEFAVDITDRKNAE